MTLLLAVLTAATAWATTYTVTLKAGDGTGIDVTISNSDAANVAYPASNGQFWLESSGWWFKFPDCPSSFTAPEDELIFAGWKVNGQGATLSPGTLYPINSNLSLIACWIGTEDARLESLMPSTGTLDPEFSPDGKDYELLVTYTGSPVEVTVTAVPIDPAATVDYDGHGDNCPKLNYGSSMNINVTNGGNSESYFVVVRAVCSITMTIEGEGTAKVYSYGTDDEKYTGKQGDSFRLEATPADGWLFKEWQLVSGGGTLDRVTQQNNGWYQFPLFDDPDNVVLKAVFEPEPITLADDADNTAALDGRDGLTRDVTLADRTLYCDGDWNTLCLPFSVSDLTGTPLDGFTVKELDTQTEYDGHTTGLDGSTLYLNFKNATGITAGVPYIVKKLAVKDGATTPTYAATAGTAGSIAQQGYDKLVDGSVEGYRWRTDISGGYCEFNADAPVHVTGYTLTTSNQSADYDPLVWTLQAKVNAGDAWTVIDSRNVSENGGDALPGSRTTGKTYTVQKQGTYQYFRFEVTQTNSTHLCLSELTLQACYPSDIDNIESPTFTGVTISTASPAPVASTDGTVSFVGSYSPVGLTVDDKSNLFLGAANTLYWPNGANNADGKYYVGACRAYFHVSEPSLARAFVLSFGDDLGSETGIIDIPADTTDAPASKPLGWYTLDGRRLAAKPTQPGIYIVGGRKIIIK